MSEVSKPHSVLAEAMERANDSWAGRPYPVGPGVSQEFARAVQDRSTLAAEVLRLEEQLEANEKWMEGARELIEQLEALQASIEIIQQERDELLVRPQPDTDSARLADPDGVGNSELERCNEISPDGSMFCDRFPDHEGPHINWRAAEWGGMSAGAFPASVRGDLENIRAKAQFPARTPGD